MPRPRGLGKFPERDHAASGCRVLMRNGKWLTSERPALGPPPRTMTSAEIRIDKSLRGDKWLSGQR